MPDRLKLSEILLGIASIGCRTMQNISWKLKDRS